MSRTPVACAAQVVADHINFGACCVVRDHFHHLGDPMSPWQPCGLMTYGRNESF